MTPKKEQTQNYELVPYKIDDTKTIEVTQFQDDVWLTQKQMAELFDVDKSRISRHLQNIFDDNELDKNSVVAFSATTGNDGKKYNINHYNLDAIISVGYRVNSKKGIMFRQWATKIIKDRIKQEYEKRNSYNENLQSEEIFISKKAAAGEINNLLRSKGITQQQIAKDLGISYVTICKVINGKSYNQFVLNYLKEILGINEEENKLFIKSKDLLKSTLNGDLSAFKKLNEVLNSIAVIYDFNNGETNA